MDKNKLNRIDINLQTRLFTTENGTPVAVYSKHQNTLFIHENWHTAFKNDFFEPFNEWFEATKKEVVGHFSIGYWSFKTDTSELI